MVLDERGMEMFEIGTCIICGQHGVCKVEAIGPIKLPGMSKEKDYYTLSQFHSKSGVCYVPVDSDKVIMRLALSKDEAEKLIDEIDQIEELWIDNEKRREDIFKKALRTCDNREWVKIIKTLYARKQLRLAQGKKVTASDERCLKAAEDCLYGELSVELGIPKKDVEKCVIRRINAKEKIV